jgi:hypothetical protein
LYWRKTLGWEHSIGYFENLGIVLFPMKCFQKRGFDLMKLGERRRSWWIYGKRHWWFFVVVWNN